MTVEECCSIKPPSRVIVRFRKGGAARDLVRGKRWLLLTSWLNLDRGKRRQLNALFALNRRMLKAYLLKESLSQLRKYT